MKLVQITSILVALAGAAHAEPPVNENIRCIMLSNLYANGAKDEHLREIASDSRFFYLGRIADSMTEAQIKAAAIAEGKTISNANAGAEMNRCAEPMIARAKLMSAVSASLAQQKVQ